LFKSIKSWYKSITSTERHLSYDEIKIRFLKVFSFVAFIACLIIFVYQGMAFLFIPASFNIEYLINSAVATGIFLYVWRFLIHKPVYFLRYLFVLTIIVFISLLSPQDYVRFIGFFAAPILVASFVIHPWSSFRWLLPVLEHMS